MSEKGVVLAEVHNLSESSEDDNDFSPGQPSKQKSMPKKRSHPDEILEPSNSEVLKLLLQQNQTLMKIVEKR